MNIKGLHIVWISKVWQNTTKRFLISFLSLFILFHYFNLLYIGLVSPGGLYVPFLNQHLDYIQGLRKLLIETSAAILRQFNYDLYTTPMRLHVDGHGGIILVYSCLGYGIMSVFTAFVLSWPGKSWKNRLIFLISGLILIQTLNIGRLIGLSLLGQRLPLLEHIDHHTLFNLMVYAVLILSIYLWINTSKKGKTR